MAQNKVQADKLDPQALLTMVESQARKMAYENAVGAAAHFVEKLIEANKILTIGGAVDAFNTGVASLRQSLQKDLVAIAMQDIEASLPQVPKEAGK